MRAWVMVVAGVSVASIAVAVAQPAQGSNTAVVDAGVPDAPPTDASVDAGVVDAAPPDAAPPDAAPPDATQAAEAAAASPMPVRDVRAYVSSAAYFSGTGTPFLRLAAGGSYRHFPVDGGDPIDVRLGFTVHTGGVVMEPGLTHRASTGIGGEAELVTAYNVSLRLGLDRGETLPHWTGDPAVMSYITPIMLTAGLRLYLARHAFLGVDVFHFVNTPDPSDYGETFATTGVLLGGGITSCAAPLGESTWEPETRPVASGDDDFQHRVRRVAWSDLDEARQAAQRGDCKRVERLGADVRVIDREFYTQFFIVDAALARCTRRDNREDTERNAKVFQR